MSVERLGSLKADLNIPVPDPILYNSGDVCIKNFMLFHCSINILLA